MTTSKYGLFGTFFLSLLVVMASLSASAQGQMSLQEAMSELGAAKEQGFLGERQNGYLGVVQTGENAEQIADLINDARRAEYTRIAEQNNIAVSDVEAMAGKRAIERTSAGHYIEVDGDWVVKR
ncbi:YdbL family protein [Aliidiomarina soli]|nr:YdbL family protein [Aliidiomarina soli]